MTAQELLDAVLPRLKETPQTMTFLQAVNTILEIIIQRLWLTRSELLEADFEETVAASGSTATLAAGTLGLKEQPWIIYNSTRYTLYPLLPGWRDKTSLSTARRPEFYRLRGLGFTLYPATDIEITLKAEVYKRSTTITALTDTLPFLGIFDQVLTDALGRIGQGGLLLTIDPAFALYVNQQVDQLGLARPAKHVVWRYPA